MEMNGVSNIIDKKQYFVIIITLSEYIDNIMWRHGQVVRQRSATPLSPVQIWLAPLKIYLDVYNN